MHHPDFITADSLKSFDTIGHSFFTRKGGVSEGIYAALNCGFGSDDSTENVKHNRILVAQAADAELTDLITPRQTHSAVAHIAERAWSPDNAVMADSIVTNKTHLRIAVLTADCAPVLLTDAKAGVVAAAHAGWRGAQTGIIKSTVEKMEQLGARRENIYAAIGPCISQRAYEVGPEFFDRFCQESRENACFFEHFHNESIYFDLTGYVTKKLKEENITHVEVLNLCTLEDESLFFSYRRSVHKNEPDYGRQISVIWLR